MLIKILDPNLKITFHGEHKREFAGVKVYEVDRETGRTLILANFAVEVIPQETEKKTDESQNA